MRSYVKSSVVSVVALTFFAVIANAGTVLIDFETVPSEPTGPSLFSSCTAATINVPGVASISGGCILGDATNFPAQDFATPPNVYATAGFGTTPSSTITIAIDPAFSADEVSFPLFNGSTQTESYEADAFDGATLVASQILSDLPSNLNSGFGVVDLTAADITSVNIFPTALDAGCCGGWDYLIDSIALNESIETAFAPEPTTFVLFGLGLAAVGAIRRKVR
jgi:hypothetical protein